MSARDWADLDVAPLGGDAQARAFAAARAAAPAPRAMVLADASGHAYWWACLACARVGVTRRSKERAQAEATAHNEEEHS